MSCYSLKGRSLHRKTGQASIVAFLVGVVFFGAAIGAVGLGGHLHEATTDHSAMHTSFVCVWMCAASSVVVTAVLESSIYFISPFVLIAFFAPKLFSLLTYNLRTRAPPLPF